MGIVKHTLGSTKTVELATWEHLSPPQHGQAMQSAAWDPEASRRGLSFYPATDEYMRNTWAVAHMHPTSVELKGKRTLLFYNESSGTWHTSDALDIDHRTQWKQHLTNLGVANGAEAQMGYNDVSNLRLLPAPINRARDSADAAMQNQDEWAKWREERFGFDPSQKPPQFDPDKDLARRHASSYEKAWTDENTRSDLDFDASVRKKWFQAELFRSFQGEVEVTRPVPPGDKMTVPLFACAATEQLCTRDAFDIDHQIAFETLLKEMPKHTKDGTLSMGEVRDAYNETTNLRLMSRSANASHEWELTARGEFREVEKEKPERPNEFAKFAVPATMSPQEETALREALEELRARDRYKMQIHRQLEENGIIGFRDPRAVNGPVMQLNHPQHPDYPRFAVVMQAIDRLDPNKEILPTQEHRDNLAAALATASRRAGLPGVDAVDKGGKDGTELFAAYHPKQADERYTSVSVTQGAMTPMAYSTFENDSLRAQAQMQAQAQQAQLALQQHTATPMDAQKTTQQKM